VLVVVGEHDDLVSGGRELAGKLPNARFLELPSRDHLSAVPAQQFKQAAVEFLEGRQ
jgi:pimeloyl-ACP methyl ester carboxylesterase